MSDSVAAIDMDLLAMQSAGQLAYLEAELDALDRDLERVSLWRPAAALRAESEWVRGKVGQLGEAWGKKLVVAIVGPSGAGKSTLLNALAGRELSRVGYERPTTRDVVIYASARADAQHLVDALGADRVQVELAPGTADLEYLVLVDTPDTNTLPENQGLLAETLEHVDLMLAVFSAQNPKLQDNITFLAPYVRRLPADAVVPVLNRVDRIALEPLRDDIVPDLRREIAVAWGRELERVYAVSAAASLPTPSFPDDEAPLHGMNAFGELRSLLFDTLNQAHQVVDRRLERAEHLIAVLGERRCGLLGQHRGARAEAGKQLGALETEAEGLLLAEFKAGRQGDLAALQAGLYRSLAGRWWGPVGWLVALWSLLLRLSGSVSNLVTRGGSTPGAAPATGRGHVGALAVLAGLYAERWPPIGDALVAAGFDASVRGGRAPGGDELEVLEAQAGAQCDALTEAQVGRLGTSLSSAPVQLLLNLPLVGLLGWVAYQTLWGFYQQQFLPSDYFRHAGITLAVVWLLSFILLQLLCSLLLRGPVRRRLAEGYAETYSRALIGPMREQLAALDSMERGCR